MDATCVSLLFYVIMLVGKAHTEQNTCHPVYSVSGDLLKNGPLSAYLLDYGELQKT